MGLFSRKKSIAGDIITPSFIPVSFLNSILANASATDKQLMSLYLAVPELQAIINYKATAFSNMVVRAVDKKGDYKEIPQLALFDQPNPLQGFAEFTIQYYVLRSIFGNAFIHPIYGNDRAKTVAMWNLPPMDVDIKPAESGILPFNATTLEEIIKDYTFQYNGKRITYEPKEIIHYNDNQIRFENEEFLLGESKLTALMQPCENIKSAYEARGVLIQNSALGILSNDGTDQVGITPFDPKDKEQLQNDYKKYGLSKSKWQLILTNMALKWQSMAVDVGKLKLYEEVDSDFRTIANAYSFPPEILQTDSTYENKEKAIKQLYQDVLQPEADGWLAAISNFMGLKDIQLVSDFSHIPELQADIEMHAKSMNWASAALAKAIESGFITAEEAREEFKNYLL